MAATASFAQSSVTIYGNLDQAVYRQKEDGKSLSDINSNSATTSTLGFKGSEDLGSGLTANFNLLSELSMKEGRMGSTTTGNAATGQTPDIFTRGATVGVASKTWGSFDIGRVTDSAWVTQGTLNNTGLNSFGWNALTATSGNPGATNGQGVFSGKTTTDTTFSGTTTTAAGVTGTANTAQTGSSPLNFGGGVSYTSPNLNGLVASVQSFGSNNSSNAVKTGNGMSYSLSYTSGDLRVVFGNTYRAGSDGAKATSFTVYGAEYKMGKYNFVGGVTKQKYEGTMATLDDITVTGLGIGYDLTPQIELKAGYTTMKDDEQDGYKTTLTAVTARYKFSARTSMYAGYGTGKNTGASNKQSIFYGANTVALQGAQNLTGMMVGIKHAF